MDIHKLISITYWNLRGTKVVLGIFQKHLWGAEAKIFIVKIFRPSPSDPPPPKFKGPLFAMKIKSQLHRKACNSIFNGKSVVIFFKAPLQIQGLTILRAPFYIRPP